MARASHGSQKPSRQAARSRTPYNSDGAPVVNIASVDVRENEDALIAVADITMPDQQGEAWFNLPLGSGTDLEAATDAFFVIGLILAMGSDGVLTMDQPVSRRLHYSNRRAIQDVLLTWHPDRLHAAEVDVPVREQDKAPKLNHSVTCFTGGVDSFDSLINNEDDIEALVYVHGYDISLSRTEIREATSMHLREVSAETGKELIEIETNIRRFLNKAGSWPLVTHGPALASVGHLLSGRFGRLVLPGSHTYADGFVWGSDAMIDHLWSNDRLSVVTDGAGSTRVKKVIGLAHNSVAQRHLRVCWQNTGKYNCGECDKCVRTMVTLSLAGALPRFETFESEIPLDVIRKRKVTNKNNRSFTAENLEYADEVGATKTAAVLRKAINDYDEKMDRKASLGVESPKSTSLDQRVMAIEKRVARVEKREGDTRRELRRLQKMWPIRKWTRYIAGRHATS